MGKDARLTISKFNEMDVNKDNSANSLALLFDYTKFHIGVYLTMTSVYVALATIKVNETFILKFNETLLWLAILFTLLAGFAGGVIISSITQIQSTKSSDFLKCRIGPWDCNFFHFHALRWTYIEHTSFWFALILAMLSFICINNP